MRISWIIWKYHENDNVWNLNYLMPKQRSVDSLISTKHLGKKKLEKKIIHIGHIRKYQKISKIWDFTYFQTILCWMPQNWTVLVPEWSMFDQWIKILILVVNINPFIKYSHFQNGQNRKNAISQNFPNRLFSFFDYVNQHLVLYNTAYALFEYLFF